MLIQVCLLLLSIGVYASYADDPESTTKDELFDELDFVFPTNFLSRYPEEGEFFRLKIIMYLFFNIFAKYLGENEPIKFWSKFNQNDFNRVAIDAAFYEYLTEFTDRKTKRLFYHLESSARSQEDIAIDRIGNYLDNLSAETTADPTETQTKTEDYKDHETEASSQIPPFGIPGKDFPSYCDIPQTSFTCENKLIPGIYADEETKCQVFHACWPHRMDSFLCPIGTTFNQALSTCDLWHESDCTSTALPSNNFSFFKSKTTKNTEPTVTAETQTTSKYPSVFSPEPESPEYDGTCQSLISKSLKHRMKVLPVKCKVTNLKPKLSDKLKKYDGKRYIRLMADTLSKTFRDMFAFIVKATELGSSKIASFYSTVKQPKLKTEKQTPKSHSKILKATTEFTSTHEEVDPTIEVNHSSTELPSDELRLQLNPRFKREAERHVHSVRKSTLLKPSKPSEESKKHVFDIMMASMELGGSILNDNVLPFMDKIVLDSRRKMTKSKKV
ncbi:U-scoloptoxin(01)-Er1a like protein [Argiope bruennichi]|uniref:U-scoloptoxin(01)-Er1a like protein n=1 Tax=Argiope bruennichi TaxID=94029 RepID=A0A8T0E570_ARGBR|nr:U-scoloptoxin(01)-Er1a like protein [Argiope bruennichi]